MLVYAVTAPGKLGDMKVFGDLPEKKGEQIDNQPDGMCLDADGNLYVAHYGMKQVQVLDPDRQADPPLSRRQLDHEQRRLRRPRTWATSTSPAAWATNRVAVPSSAWNCPASAA